MSIFDLFTFKGEIKKVFTKENLLSILDLAKAEIIKQATSNLLGIEKKKVVDEVIRVRIECIKEDCKNKFVLLILEKIEDAIPIITQNIYDNLKAHIENL